MRHALAFIFSLLATLCFAARPAYFLQSYEFDYLVVGDEGTKIHRDTTGRWTIIQNETPIHLSPGADTTFLEVHQGESTVNVQSVQYFIKDFADRDAAIQKSTTYKLEVYRVVD